MKWYKNQGSSGQALVVDEETGRTVAVAYDGADGNLLAAAPALRTALSEILIRLHNNEPFCTELDRMATQALQQAQPEEDCKE